MILRLMEWLVAVVFVAILVFELAIPLFRGMPMFPWFRRRRLFNRLAEAKEHVADEAVGLETRKSERQAKSIHNSR